jgi:protein TonB
MKQAFGSYTKRDKATGFAAVLVLHSVVLYGLWSYQVIPPPAEALIVFANFVNPPAAAKRAEPTAPKPARTVPIRQETPREVPPVTQNLLVSSAPVTSPAEPVAPPLPIEKAPTGPVTDNSSGVTMALSVPASNSDGGAGSMLLTGDLSVTCPERPSPTYPKLSARLGEQGKTILLVELDELGRVINVAIKKKSGVARLDEAAIAAVKTWRCNPAKRNGVAVRAVALQPFNFILKGP